MSKQSSILNFIMPKAPVSVAATADVTLIHPEQELLAELESNRGNGPLA